MSPRVRVGWREWVGFPELGIRRIKAKIDTGARTSALHAYGFEPFERGGERWLRFRVHPRQKNDDHEIECEAPLVDWREVKSSTGTVTERPVVLTDLEWMGERWTIELTLVRRDSMGFRLLIGREAMRRRWIVDPARSYVGGTRTSFRAAAVEGSATKRTNTPETESEEE
jgi:hypothetical protein